jgi:HD-like signal output (HDOD) protein
MNPASAYTRPTTAEFLSALKHIERFSPAPVILAKALKLLRDPQSDIDSIALLVGRDAALVADIIRCANSANYGGGTNSSIGDAVQRIGMKETIRILNLSVAKIVSSRDLGCYGIIASDFWAESLFNGLFMRELARATSENDPEEAYTAGLLRFIGRLAINQTIENLHSGIFWDGSESLTDWEVESVGLPQSEAGAILLGTWNFPERIIQAIGAQNEPATLKERNWLADGLFFASAMLPQGVGTPFLPSVGPIWGLTTAGTDFLKRCNLDAASVDIVLSNTSTAFDEIRKGFGV